MLAQGHVEGADTAAHRGGQGTLDGDHELLHRLQGLIGQPGVAIVDPGRLLTGIDLHPGDLALAAIGLLDRGVDHFHHHRRYIDTDAVAFDVGNDGVVGDVQRAAGVHGNLLTFGGDYNLVVCHE